MFLHPTQRTKELGKLVIKEGCIPLKKIEFNNLEFLLKGWKILNSSQIFIGNFLFQFFPLN
jgi:hypothetical protein